MDTKKVIKNFPWIFWINISIRKQWFSYWWRTRGSNYVEYQVCIFRISVGMPWINDVLIGKLRDYKGLDSAVKTNEMNRNNRFSFQVGKYSDAKLSNS